MLPVIDEKLISWLNQTSTLPHPHLLSMEEYAKQEKVPIVSRQVGAFLYWLSRLVRPRSVLEIGTGIGYSTAFLALGAAEAHVHTFERDPQRQAQTEINLRTLGLAERVTLHAGDVRREIEQVPLEFDLVFIDAEKNGYPDFWEIAWLRLRPGGVIVADNVLFRGIVVPGADFDRKYRHNVRNLGQYLDLAQHTPNAITSLLAVGDGLALTIKNQAEDETK